jgi:DNA replication protein DnaC
MLTNPTMDHLKDLRLSGMLEAYSRQLELPENAVLTFEERFSLIVDYEWNKRRTNYLNKHIKRAGFREEALLEDIIKTEKRKYNKSLFQTLCTTDWIDQGLNLVITGPTGVGKSYFVQAFGYMACRRSQTVQYYRTSELMDILSAAKTEGSFQKVLRQLQKCDLLILDDWGLNKFNVSETIALTDMIDERNLKKSMIVVSQIPSETWGDVLSDDTRADAIMDRVLKNSYHFELDGPSFRGIEAKKRMESAKVIDESLIK